MRATETPGLYVNAQGIEVEDPAAEPIGAMSSVVDEATDLDLNAQPPGSKPAPPTDFNLEPETEEDIRAREEAQQQREKTEAEAKQKDEQKAKADAEVDSFSLTGSDRLEDTHGQGFMFDLSTGAVRPEASQTNASIDSILPPSPNESVDKDALFDDLLDQEFSDAKPAPQASGAQPQTPSNQSPRATPRSAGEAASSAASNVSEAFNEAASGLVDLFNPGGGTFNSGLIFNEETYAKAKPHFIAMASHLKGAATDVADLMRAIIRALREQFGMTKEGVANMKPYIIRFAEDIESGVINLEGQDNVQSSTADEERDRADGEGRADQSTADAAGSRASGEAGSNVEADEGEGQDGASGVGVPGARPPAVGGGSGSDVSSKDGTLGAPRDRQRRGGDGSGAGGLPSGSGGTTPTSSAAAGSSVRVDLDAASKVSIKTADAENIKASLPQLLESQREDVLFAENRFKNGGRGVLFTNGTGTGKTFSGLGIIARQVRQGKGNILITVPGEKIAADWIKAAKQFFNIDIHQLANTQDAGPAGSVVITTYANFGQNNNLAKREWDMLVHDEAHYLSSSKSGDATAVLKTSRALTGHPRGASAYAEMMESKLLGEISDLKEKIRVYSASDSEMMWRKAEELRPRLNTLIAQMEEREAVHTANRARTWEAKQTRRLDLSATPFAYHASVDAAEGFLFDYGPEPDSSAYNTPSASDQFMIEHFGYRMRTGKLTKPDASVDQSIMERQFNRWLNQQGALSGRMLDVDFDYSREFVAVESLIGNKIDDGLSYIKERSKDKKDPLAFGYAALAGMLERSLDYHQRVRLLEAIKAPFAVERANQHIAMGRKVVIFHSRIQGGATHPFRFERLPENNENSLYNATIDDFIANRPDLYELDLGDLARPLDLFREAFGDRVTFYNGTINKKEKVANPAAFVEDDGPYDVIVVQDDAGKEGISLHDVTGKHPRALINIGLPIKPTQAIQIEGRIYRVGQQSNAIFEYFNTGTSFERWTFATKIAERASTAENLAMGDSARKLRDAFVDAFDNPTEGGPQQEQGLGGKVRDRAAYEPLSGFEEAKTHYFGNQKNNKSRSNREGVDYYATPEPIGFKMVEWSGIRPNESALEPSAGHGAIARYFPGHARSTFVEPSGNLISRLALRASGSLRQHQFEDLDEASNKYDAIIMNPPYGQGGATARDHLAKAMNHLKNGGRIVALLPDGPSANQKIEALLYGKDGESVSSIKDQLKGATGERAATLRKRLNQLENFHLRAEFGLPAVTFGRAGTTVKTRVLVIDRVDSGYQGEISQRSRRDIDADTINDLFDAIENMAVPDRLSDVKPAEEVLANFGLKLKQIQDGDNLVYELSGNTYQNRSAVGPVMRKHGGRFVKGPKIWTASSDPSSDLARALQGLPVDGLEQEQSTPDEAKPGIIEHVTQAGKTIRGVVAKGITQSQAKAIDPWTFKKNGGWFIRERHLDEQGRYPGQPGWGSLDEGGSQDVRFS
ncbi:MAG: hypothetical protein EOM21_19045, partial [Gammaproteobacteria bacterium]|nr:hypothetical protein [Gammaproteobacteria bacterium]